MIAHCEYLIDRAITRNEGYGGTWISLYVFESGTGCGEGKDDARAFFNSDGTGNRRTDETATKASSRWGE